MVRGGRERERDIWREGVRREGRGGREWGEREGEREEDGKVTALSTVYMHVLVYHHRSIACLYNILPVSRTV